MMKIKNIILLFFSVFFSLTISAQDFCQEEIFGELQPLLDTLPDGTVINLLEGIIIDNASNPKQLKSALKDSNSLPKPPIGNKQQLKFSNKDRLKSAQLIKSFNQESSPYYLEKLDSIVDLDAEMVPSYDSVLIEGEKRSFKHDEGGNLIEVIVDTLNILTNTYVEEYKVEYLRNDEGTLLQQISYSWNGSTWENGSKTAVELHPNGEMSSRNGFVWNGSTWVNNNIREYNEDGNITLSETYRENENNEWILYSRYLYTYHENGERATYEFYGAWDVLKNMWTRESKSEYNEQGLRTLYYYKKYNSESAEWEYYAKYEYEYLEDESIVETRYGWDVELKEFFQQYQNRYKYVLEYEGDNLLQETKLLYINDSWQEDYKRVFKYDQWGNTILYELYDADTWGEITERRISAYAETGQRIRDEVVRWEFDEENGSFKKIGIGFYEYIQDAEGKTLSYNRYKWNEEKEEWILDYKRLYSYPKEGESIIKRYIYNVNGYYPVFKPSYVSILKYDNIIGKYSGIIEKSLSSDWEDEIRILYNEDLKVDEILYFFDGGILDEKVKCFYDDSGRDTAWYEYEWINGEWEFEWKVTFSYQDLGNGQTIVSEQWGFGEDERERGFADNYFENGKLMKVIDSWSLLQENEWVTQSEKIIYFNYNQEGKLTSIVNESGNYHRKEEYIFSNDTLTINSFNRDIQDSNPDLTPWSLRSKNVYIVDSSFPGNQFQNIPYAVFTDDIRWPYQWHATFEYGKVLEETHYWRSNETEDFGFENKAVYYYSPASPLQGDVTINGYVLNDTGDQKSIAITTKTNGEPVPGAKVLLCAKENDFVLASDSTDSDGFYEFIGVPIGNFYLKVELEGYEQTSTYDIEVAKDSSIIDNKNFIVLDAVIITGIEEFESSVRVYPNPASNNVNIASQREIIAVRVRDINGRTRFINNNVNSTNVNITTETLSAGLYIFEIKTNTSIINKKIIVKK